jgi:hypothetical protein
MHFPPGGGLAVSWTLRPYNLTTENIYDYDPPAGTSWMEGVIIDNVVYVKDNEGITIILRAVKNTTDPVNPRFTMVVGYKYVKQGTDTVKVKMISAYKTYTTVTSYGSGKDTDTVLGSGTVSGGQVTITFTMPSKNLKIRIYVEGADITLS